MNTKKILPALMLFLSLIVHGCFDVGISINPVYTEEDLFFDPALAGDWISIDQDFMFTFKKFGVQNYELSITDLEAKNIMDGTIEAHLFRLGKHVLMDWFPMEPDSGNVFYNIHLLPAHTFWKVKLDEDSLTIMGFEADWFQELAEKKAVDIKHIYLEERGVPVFTASTEEIQTFILEHFEDAFEPIEESDLKLYRRESTKTNSR